MTRIGDYELVDVLERGNHGVFYTARPPARLGVEAEYVAIKVMERHSTDVEFRRVANELRAFAGVSSDHLVRLLDAGQQDGRLFYAMDWYQDGSLANPRTPLNALRCVRAVAAAARGAHALHEVGVVHRDIKPANVLLDGDSGRLSDLGLAQLMTPGMTTTGIGPVGSIEFMEPDVIWGERAARVSDIWSLALTLHRSVCGVGVYGDIPEQNVLEAFRHVLHERPLLSPTLPGVLEPILDRALAERRSERYRTAIDFAEELDRSCEEISTNEDSASEDSASAIATELER